ncbi:MAG: hypothetical protein JSV85_04815 [Candidatus Bathyarchaeota archaeon]|nr:MAG: hypothetical protein JSV85_04815 [Candidatus Bathyarchaeota archaeon]
MNYEEKLPSKQQLQRGFEALETDKEKALYLLYATSGFNCSEALSLTKEDVDRKSQCVKAKHDNRTKKAGVTFYNDECAEFIEKIWNGNETLFAFKEQEFRALWIKASTAAGARIRPQVLRKWHSTMLGELTVPDRFGDLFQGRLQELSQPNTILEEVLKG